MSGRCRAAPRASIRQMSGQESRGSVGEISRVPLCGRGPAGIFVFSISIQPDCSM